MPYVKFLDRHEVVAATVSSTLSVWDLVACERVRTLSGHVNVRNFVGMEVNGPYIACGSETSQVRLRAGILLSSEVLAGRGEMHAKAVACSVCR